MKIIPAIDLMDGRVVRLYKGDPNQKTIYSNDPIQIAKNWQEQGADMVHLVDLDATLGRGSNIDLIKKITSTLDIPCQVAGGLRNAELIEKAVGFADRIVIGTMAFKDLDTLNKVKQKHLSKMVISADHKDGNIAINGWQSTTNIPLIQSIKDFVKMGFSEFLITNVNRDGTLEGPDTKFLKESCQVKGAKIIASGGISKPSDIAKVKECGAFGVILGKAMYEGHVSIKEAKSLA